MRPSISDLRTLNQNLEDIPENQLIELLGALETTGFEWNSIGKYFSNSDLNKKINVDGLHHFDARSITEEWGNREFLIGNSNQTFLTKFIFWGIPLLSISSIILLLIGKLSYGGSLLAFTGVMYYLVESARKYHYSKQERGIKPSTISSILLVLWIINVVSLFASDTSNFGEFIFVVLSVAILLFFFKIKS